MKRFESCLQDFLMKIIISKTNGILTVCDEEIPNLLDENITQKKLSEQLGVTQQTISVRLHAIGKIYKKAMWVPRELIEYNKKR